MKWYEDAEFVSKLAVWVAGLAVVLQVVALVLALHEKGVL